MGTALLTAGCIAVMISVFFPWSEGILSGAEIICGLGIVPLALALFCLGLTYVDITRGRFSRATLIAQLIMAALAAIPWFLNIPSFCPHCPNSVKPGFGFYLAGLGYLLWLLGAVLGWRRRIFSVIGAVLAIILFSAAGFVVWWKDTGAQIWFQRVTVPGLEPVVGRYMTALAVGNWDEARSMYCSSDCLQKSQPQHESEEDVLYDHAQFFAGNTGLKCVDRSRVPTPTDSTGMGLSCVVLESGQGWVYVNLGSGAMALDLRYSLEDRCFCEATFYPPGAPKYPWELLLP